MSKAKKFLLGALAAVGLAAATMPARADQPAFNWRRYSGRTITFLSSNHPWPSAVLPYLDQFKQLTGITVQVETFNEDQMWQRLATLLQEHSTDVDVFMTLKAREGRLYYTSGWYRDLAPMIKDPTLTSPDYDFSDFTQNLLELPAYHNQVVAIPLNVEGPLVYWRKDIFATCHLNPPKTLEEIGVIAAKLKACKPGITSFVSRGLRDALPYTFVPMFYTLGGNYDKLAQNQAYCSPAGEHALSYYTELLNNYGPPGVSNYTFYQITDVVGQGRAAMSFESSNEFGRVMAYPKRSDDTGVEVLPPSTVTNYSKPLVIDWGIAISAFSKKAGPAWYFLQWATSKEMDEKIALKGIAPPRQSVFRGVNFAKWISEEPNRQQWADSLKQIAATGYANTVPAAMIQAPEANDVIGAGVQSVMLGNASPKDAGCKMDSDLNKLMPK
jgi:multiple sugar transport system substrate-binding protein